MKITLRDIVILFLGIGLGLGIYLLYDNYQLSQKKVADVETKKMTTELSKLESSLDSLHQLMGLPLPGEWLYDHNEAGQSIEKYMNSSPIGKTIERNKIYIQSLGSFTPTQKSILILTADYLSRFYNLPVEILDPISSSFVPDEFQRQHQGYKQLNSLYILNKILNPKLPGDAAAYLAFTNLDLYPSDNYNFVFGQGSLKNRVGVYSIARYGDPDSSRENYQLCLSRTLKVAAHELGHLFSIKHCIKYNCVMNGSNHLEESDSKPHALCPIDLLKVCWNLETDEVYRFEKLAEFWESNGFPEQVIFCRKSIASIERQRVLSTTTKTRNND